MNRKYKILFLSSGDKVGKSKIIVNNQGESLKKNGLDVEYFPLVGKGNQKYLKNIFSLRKFCKQNKIDLIHAHYSLSGFVASSCFVAPVVVSLMGSDIHMKGIYKLLIKFFNSLLWSACIVKSEKMKDFLDLKNGYVIPNGVDLQKFHPVSKEEALQNIGYKSNKKIILFAADPERIEKNYNLAKKALNKIKELDLEIIYLKNVSNDLVKYHYNAADVVLLTSLYEGSPNVIKEAMACNRPIVSTNVGDVSQLFGNIEGCFLTSFDPEDVAVKLQQALDFAEKTGETSGRDRIVELGLNDDAIAKRIIEVYEQVIN